MFRLGDKVLARALVQGHEPEGYGSHPWVLYKLVLVALLEALAGTGSAYGYDMLEFKGKFARILIGTDVGLFMAV